MRHRLRAIGICGALAVALRLATPSPPPSTLEGLADMLGAAAGGEVQAVDIAWEPSAGMFADILIGRRVLFLASSEPGEPRDLYRAHVRLGLEGRPVAVGRVRNLTETSVGDERALTVLGARAAYATAAYDKVESISLLDLRARGDVEAATWLDHLMGAVTSFQQTGTTTGIGRVELALDRPAKEPIVSLSEDRLLVKVEPGRTIAVDLARGTLIGDPDEVGAHVMEIPALHKPPILWAVDTVRAEIGPEPIAWLEKQVFDVRDAFRRFRYRMRGDAVIVSEADEPALPTIPTLDGSAAGDDGGYWPPAPIASVLQGKPEPGEGVWQPVTRPWLKRLPDHPGLPEPPPYFYTTTIRPDARRPYAKVLIVAMDMRQLELDMEAGVEDPKPLTGAQGAGKIPRDPKILRRVVAAFNGAFKTTHGEYGMMVNKRVLLPPQPHAATVLVTDDMRVGLGSWGESKKIPAGVRSYRQNLEALVEDGRVSPSGRTQWGWQLPGTSMFTERSGLCMTEPGHLYYVWGDELSADTLGRAMLQAGCTYGIHLDMNPHHTGFVFASVRDASVKERDVELLSPQMGIQPARYLEWSRKDFFYVMLRDPSPAGKEPFVVDEGVQPAPGWLPGIWRALVHAEASPERENETRADADVHLVAFDRGRVDWRIRPGSSESLPGELPSPSELHPDEADRVVSAIGLGNGHGLRPLGLAIDGKSHLRFRPGEALLVVDASNGMRILTQEELGEAIPENGDVAQLPLIVEDGRVLAYARDRGSLQPRAALCVAPDGRTVIAMATADSDEPTALALSNAGCARAVALDRGSHHPAVFHRTGTDTPPRARYEQTTLFAVSRPMLPRTFRWDGEVGNEQDRLPMRTALGENDRN